MELSFNEQEQRLLRFLKEEFLEKGSKPITNHDFATMHRDVMKKFGLDLPQYREVMARLEHHGIVQAIAIGATNGHLRIDPVVVEIVRQLDESPAPVQPTFLQRHPYLGPIIGSIIGSIIIGTITIILFALGKK